jgi:hypothetical protein
VEELSVPTSEARFTFRRPADTPEVEEEEEDDDDDDDEE